MKLDGAQEKQEQEGNELDGIDELIKGMERVTIDKGEDYEKAQKRKQEEKEEQQNA